MQKVNVGGLSPHFLKYVGQDFGVYWQNLDFSGIAWHIFFMIGQYLRDKFNAPWPLNPVFKNVPLHENFPYLCIYAGAVFLGITVFSGYAAYDSYTAKQEAHDSACAAQPTNCLVPKPGMTLDP